MAKLFTWDKVKEKFTVMSESDDGASELLNGAPATPKGKRNTVKNLCEGDIDNIKTRLRNNSGTSCKIKRDTISGTNAKQLRKMYEGEGKRMEQFLNKQAGSGAGDTEDDSEVEFNCLTKGNCGIGDKGDKGDKNDKGDNKDKGDNSSQESVTAVQTEDTGNRTINTKRKQLRQQCEKETVNSRKGNKKDKKLASTPEPSNMDNRILLQDAVCKDIEDLERKIQKLQEGSMERMLLEMRLDIKLDNLKMMQKIDGVSLSAGNLQSEIKKIKEDQQEMDRRLKYTQDVQTTELVRADNVNKEIEKLTEQVRVLKGIVQKQDQILTLKKIEVEEDKLRTLRNNLLISGLDKADEENETTTAKLVTDFFTQVMKIRKPIGIRTAERIGKASPRTILVKLVKVEDKGLIYKNVSALKEAKNSQDEPYYINNQLPPKQQEQERKFRKMIKHNASLGQVGK